MARLVTFEDPAGFRARAQPFMAPREAENNLLFGILHAIEQGRYEDPFLAVLERDDRVAAVAIMTPPHKLVLSSSTVTAARSFAVAIAGHGVALPGVNGEAEQALAFAETWAARIGSSFQREMAQRIYALAGVRAPEGVPGRARFAERTDRDLLVGWVLAFESEALTAHDPDVGRATARVEAALTDEDARILLWEVDGVAASMAGQAGPTPHGMRVGPVYTPPEHRRHGYAAACVAELSARLLAGGRTFCFLYTDLSNPTSNSVYRRIGYEPVCDAAVYRFDTPARPASP